MQRKTNHLQSPMQCRLVELTATNDAVTVDKAPWLGLPSWFVAVAAFRQLTAPKERAYLLEIDQSEALLCRFALVCDESAKNWQSLSCYYTPEYQALVHQPQPNDVWTLLVPALDKCCPRWQHLHIWPVRERAKTVLQQHFAAHAYPYSTNWQAQATSLADYWQHRPSALRNTCERKGKKLQRDGATIEVFTQLTEKRQADYWQVYAQSWKEPEPDPTFINWLLEQSAAQGTLRLGVIYLHDKPIACQLWLVVQQRAYIFKLAQDQQFDGYSPGSVLMSALITHVMTQDQVQHIDFLTGNDQYKAMWMDSSEILYGVEIFNKKHFVSYAKYLIQSAKNRCKTLLQWLQGIAR